MTTTTKWWLSRDTWLLQNWRRSKRGNEFLNVGGFNIVVLPPRRQMGRPRQARWTDEGALVENCESGDEAKLAALQIPAGLRERRR